MLPKKRGKIQNPFLCHEFFVALEKSKSATRETGWLPRHILLSRDKQPLGLMPLFLKSHSMGEYVFDQAWADALERAGANYYPKLQSSIPFTPVTAPKLLVPDGGILEQSALLDAARQLATHHGASSVHATFVTEPEEKLALNVGWLFRHDTQFHWKNDNYENFEHFLGSLVARKRKLIRSERRKALQDDIKIEWIEGSEIEENHWDAFFEFYQDTGARKWGRPYLTREFFSLLSQTMPQNLILMLARSGDKYIAGALNFVGPDALYGRYWGCSQNVPFLHFELCYYQAIEYAIQKGIKTVEAGAQGAHKLARGYAPTLTRSIHWLGNEGLYRAVKDYLHQERLAISADQQTLTSAAPFKKPKT